MQIAIWILGIVLNWIVLNNWVEESPEGAMGMGLVVILAFVPYLLVALAIVSWVVEKVRDLFDF